MPAAALMRWGRFDIAVTPDGTQFRLLDRDAEWAAFTLTGLRPTGRFTDDADEVEHGFDVAGLSGAVRHSVAQAWTIRWALSALEPTEVADGPRLAVRPGPGTSAWSWAAGAEGLLAIAPRQRAAPVIGLRLTSGWLQDDGDGFALAPAGLMIGPDRRWVGSLRAELYPNLQALAATLPPWLAPLELTVGEPWEFRQPDQALIVRPPAVSRPDGDAIQVTGEPGRAGVVVHSPRGLTALILSFAPTLDSLLAAGASAVLRGSVSPSPAAAFVVAEASGRSLVSDPQAAQDWLADDDWDEPGDLLAIATGIVRGQRNGAVDAARSAFDRLAHLEPAPGSGRVVMAAWLAALASGQDARDRAVALLVRPATDDWVALELNVLNLRSAEVAGPLFDGLINALGGDLPGEPVGLGVVRQAQLTGLLQLCPEEWPMAAAAAACALKNARRLLAAVAASDFASPDDVAVLAWLALGDSLV